jgi:uncharacterized protein involved in exopolysaccharide biosynthesis
VTVHSHSTPPAIGAVRDEPEEGISLLGLTNLLLRHRRLIGTLALLGMTLLPALALLSARSFTSGSVFMPQTRSAASSLSGLAAQLGFTLPSTESGQTPAFYADLIESRTILGDVVDSRFEYRTPEGPVQGSLIEIYRSKGKTPALRRDAAVRRLRDDVEATTVQKTGVVELEVTAEHPALARQINQRLIDLVNQFNLRTRQSQAAKEREFTERRLEEVRLELRATEDRLQNFLQRNRDYTNSPELTFQVERLEREVAMRQEVFTTLAQAYEQAKIEEVRDTPVITVVQSPELPVRPDSRWLVVKALLGLLLGLLVGSGLAVWRAYTANSERMGSSEAAEFALLRRQAMGDLSRPWRSVARVFRLGRRAER